MSRKTRERRKAKAQELNALNYQDAPKTEAKSQPQHQLLRRFTPQSLRIAFWDSCADYD
ncbi:MAG: hypothetical protein ROM54_12795 [Anaerobiospirillum sp.]|nr:hypothetical protein [Anaerobiospirillum sp.]